MVGPLNHSSARLLPWAASVGRMTEIPPLSHPAALPDQQIDNHSRGGAPRWQRCGYRPADLGRWVHSGFSHCVTHVPDNLGRRFGVGSLFPSISFGCSLADGYRSRRHFPSRFADRRQSHSKSPSLNGSHRTERLPKEIHAASHVAKRLSGGNVYRCPHCNNWHVGHRAPRPPVGPKRRAFVQPDDLDI